MNAISLALISSIIFNIALAQKCLGSESLIDCFSFLKKKTKKKHKIDESVKDKGAYDPDIPDIKFIDEFNPTMIEDHECHQTELDDPFISEANGTIIDKAPKFLRGKNKLRIKGWYIRPYEEEYEDMINAMFMDLNNYQSGQKDEHKQESSTIAIPNSLEKQKLPAILEEYLSTQGENEKFDEDIAMFRFMLPEMGMIIQGVWVDGLGLKLQGLCEDASVELTIT
ncbi:erythrocyte membrane antigen 1 [Plasmodium vinckei vinckei]|uniref:Erythrocyte membrane antigen 1 n=1 Tax=Plasmodium vinckei vinckei TaxID=54757 RepID=A0A081I965_PLAVN|nr:erythrocyte membrane antigen 1 [Plasmodium vinckei vinckei]KEG00223.1 hypothetical protein YYE_04931 [Plasmodium vinckei vinckei]VEV55628.1 erythrocyte membrane antigen 1 [Plasmodium vinckei vinckei]